jgi:CDP-paratose 2-epimerase
MGATDGGRPRVVNVSGGVGSACSLRHLSEWCAGRFGQHRVSESPEARPFDVAWLVLDSRAAADGWSWSPATPREAIFEEIAAHAERRPDWLELTHE